MSDYGITDTGFTPKPISVIATEMFDDFESLVGEVVNREPDSVISQIIGVQARPIADIWERMQEIYNASYPASASGVNLDNIGELTGHERLDATPTKTTLLLTGTTGTNVPAGNRFKNPTTGDEFASTDSATIAITNCASVDARIVTDTLNWQPYTVEIVGYSVNRYYRPYHATTKLHILQQLATIINNSTPATMQATAVDEGGGEARLELRSIDKVTGYNIEFTPIGVFTIDTTNMGTPVEIESVNTGAIFAVHDTITEIVNAVSGLDSVTNPADGEIGHSIETDSAFRIRRANTLSLIGASTLEAMRAQMLANVKDVEECTVYENDTNTTDQLVLTFDADFVANNVIIPKISGVTMATVNFTTDHATTLIAVRDSIRASSTVSATTSITGSREITIVPEPGEHVIVDSITITGGTSQAGHTVTGSSRPAHSIEFVVSGGSDEDVFNQVFTSKAAGILTHGSETGTYLDSMMVPHTVKFTRPVKIPLAVDIVITEDPEYTFPDSGITEIMNNVFAHLSTLKLGEDVILQKLYSAIYQTQGIANASVTFSTDASPGTPPYSITGNIDVDSLHYISIDTASITVSVV